MFAENTKKCYSTYLHTYLKFCIEFDLPALPATPVNIGRFIAYLGFTKAPSSIQQYLSAVRLLHLELGLPHPLQDNHHASSLLKALKRDKGCDQSYKLTFTVDTI